MQCPYLFVTPLLRRQEGHAGYTRSTSADVTQDDIDRSNNGDVYVCNMDENSELRPGGGAAWFPIPQE